LYYLIYLYYLINLFINIVIEKNIVQSTLRKMHEEKNESCIGKLD